MTSPISRSSSHEEAIEKVSVLKRVCQNSHISRKIVSITLIAVGVILVISGILLLTLTIASLPSAFSIALGATVLALGTSLISFGIAMRILKKPYSPHEEEDVLASEIIRTRGVVEQKIAEISRLQTELDESQRQLAEVSGELEIEKQTGVDLQLRLQHAEEGLRRANEENTLPQTRLQEAETTIQQQEQQIQVLQVELANEKVKVQQLEDRIRDLVADTQKKAARIANLNEDLSRVVANQHSMIERLNCDFDTEIARSRRLLLEKTAELDAAKSTIDQIQQQLNRAEQMLAPTPVRRGSSNLSLNAAGSSPTVRSRLNSWWEKKKTKNSSSSEAVTSESSSSTDHSSDERNQQNNETEETEEDSQD
ncbi:IncA protein [Chlamydia poikilotherma]|uniref:IncA protein n=1 Tax=Chlamydia poikilotherma TaxID=1967783 RepID=A0A3B0PVX0_9CHLA|nr:IncA family protein [Chlamydia poikilotherma]SYX08996.1 IncA protein [Chlamydia poikilotherma]